MVRSSVKDAPIYTVEGLWPRTKVQKIWKILPNILSRKDRGKKEHVVSLHETVELEYFVQKRPSKPARFWVVHKAANTLRYKGPRMHYNCIVYQNAFSGIHACKGHCGWSRAVRSKLGISRPVVDKRVSIFDLPSRVLDGGCFSCKWDMSDMRLWKRKVFSGNVRRLPFLSPSSVLKSLQLLGHMFLGKILKTRSSISSKRTVAKDGKGKQDTNHGIMK